jgi:hypothetical protein
MVFSIITHDDGRPLFANFTADGRFKINRPDLSSRHRLYPPIVASSHPSNIIRIIERVEKCYDVKKSELLDGKEENLHIQH